ncbi:hypothetical protein EV715DRAFT_297614 [Schizophyllum commune]
MVYTTSLSANAEQAIAVIVAKTLAVDAHDALVVVPPPAPRRAPTCCPPPDPTPFPPHPPATPTRALPASPRSARRATARPDLRSPSHVHPRERRPRSRFRQMPKTHRTRIAAQRAVARLLAAPLRAPAVGLRALGDCRARELAPRYTGYPRRSKKLRFSHEARRRAHAPARTASVGCCSRLLGYAVVAIATTRLLSRCGTSPARRADAPILAALAYELPPHHVT